MERLTHWWQNDTVYMRWINGREIVRVARYNGNGITAIYPTSDRERFNFEAASQVDDPGIEFKGIKREEIKDQIWLRLLDGEKIRDILREYQPSPLGEEQDGNNKFTYYFAKAGTENSGIEYHRHNMFHICDDIPEKNAPPSDKIQSG